MNSEPLDLRAVEAWMLDVGLRYGSSDKSGVQVKAAEYLIAAFAALRETREELISTAVRTLVNGTACWCTFLEPDEAGTVLHNSICRKRRDVLAKVRDE